MCTLTDHLPAARHEVGAVVVIEDTKKSNSAREVRPADGQATERLFQLTLQGQAGGGGDAGGVPLPLHRQLPGLKELLTDEPLVVSHLTERKQTSVRLKRLFEVFLPVLLLILI